MLPRGTITRQSSEPKENYFFRKMNCQRKDHQEPWQAYEFFIGLGNNVFCPQLFLTHSQACIKASGVLLVLLTAAQDARFHPGVHSVVGAGTCP